MKYLESKAPRRRMNLVEGTSLVQHKCIYGAGGGGAKAVGTIQLYDIVIEEYPF